MTGGAASAKRALNPSEHQLQAAFIQWTRLNEKRYPALRLAFAVPNAAKRSPALARWMKAEGLRAGVPDWWLPVPRKKWSRWSGMVIEFKAAGKKTTPAQADYLNLLIAEYWNCCVCRTTEEAIAAVEAYLS